MEYLKRVLGIEVTCESRPIRHLPNFISTRYTLKGASLDGQKVVFLFPKTELEQVEALKKHLERVQESEKLPVVLVLDRITSRQKEYLLREKIPFVVKEKQIYLPFMAVYLQERCNRRKNPAGENDSLGTGTFAPFYLPWGRKDHYAPGGKGPEFDPDVNLKGI